MCGLTGFFTSKAEMNSSQMDAKVLSMSGSLAHRGPDDQGTWIDPQAGIALGHRRLSIIDLSQQGHQPMPSACGRYVMVYNGEIYNFHLTDAAGGGLPLQIVLEDGFN